MFRLTTILFVISGFLPLFGQSNCYRMCTTDTQYADKEITHYIYTGEDTTGLNVRITKFTVVEARRELVKRRKPDCLSPNPVDCFIEKIEDIPAVTMNLYTLPDNKSTDMYDVRIETIKVATRQGGSTSESIVCPKNKTKKLITKIQTALIQKGYPLNTNGILDQATNLSITDFQRSAGLAYGELTLATLAALGVE